MKNNIQFRIDDPCAQSWDRMHPEGQGRFCGSCSKVVVDFTSMSDQELLSWFAGRQGSVCGRFGQDQLDRPMIPAAERTNSRWQYARFLLAGLLFTSEVPAQSRTAGVPVSQHISTGQETRSQNAETSASPASHSPSDSLRGRVIDTSGQPVSWATVMYNRTQGVQANGEGYFSIAADRLVPGQMLTISAIGYRSVQVEAGKLRNNGQPQTITVVQMSYTATLGMVVVRSSRTRKRQAMDNALSLVKDSLACIGLAKKGLSVYPNPVAPGTSITIVARLDLPGTYTAQLFNSSGAPVGTMQISGSQQSASIPMNIPSSAAPGAYIVRLSHPSLKKVYTRQIIVY